MMRFTGLVLLLLPLAVAAQPSDLAMKACSAYAESEMRTADRKAKPIVLDDDQHRNLERYARKLGSQFVGFVLFGNGAILNASGPAVEFSFVCLLADEKRALYFFWAPRSDAPVLTQCRRSGAADTAACFDVLLQVAEQDLTNAYANRFVEARQADASAGNEDRTAAFRRSADAWRAYRDAECARRGDGDATKACLVELTRRRARDLR
ncbi:MAG: hypothetical protein A3I63_08720 [Betaproteobacteria bacterium RIFCSPLOWO2_02_FULL_66_14]|nr:MAG: hypothetical protein A3I63_08720 [Betaproteobacteria bacterium RIFCSPLOWO2_02_FULL_66_14]